jgi:pantoate--beta-alanine ligase
VVCDVIVAQTRAQLREALAPTASAPNGIRGAGTLVATMGALHRGHAALFELAASRPGLRVASIFVNPTQFGPGEDLDRYPRQLGADLDLCRAHGIDVVFAPEVTQMYPGGADRVTVDPGPMGTILEGAHRPGHFRGVLTVVAKLLGLVAPRAAIFGQKDYQQLALVSAMVDSLCLPIEVVAAETVRDDDGLALSSRNQYLTPQERESALVLNEALDAGRAAADSGAAAVLAAAERTLQTRPAVRVDYLSLLTPDLSERCASGPGRLLVAATIGSTRLIDNVGVSVQEPPPTRGAGDD